MIENAIPNATVSREFRSDGLVCMVELPVEGGALWSPGRNVLWCRAIASAAPQKSHWPWQPVPGPMMTITRRRGVGKAGSDHRRENTSLSSASVRCRTLRPDNLGKT
jgi:hypothetical protein